MWKKGDIISIRFCDVLENQEILNKPLLVIKDSQSHSPQWTDVEYNGKTYSVRGAEAKRAG